jgi:segregation and condensation protein B
MVSSAAKRMISEDGESEMKTNARPDEVRILEALLFASKEPLDEKTLSARLPAGFNLKAALAALQEEYAARGVNLVRLGNKWAFRTASDLSWLLTKEQVETRKLSRAAIEPITSRSPAPRSRISAA